MRVSERMKYANYYRNIAINEDGIQKKMNQLSTGKRVELPSDDPFGTTRIMSLHTSLIEIEQYNKNSEDAKSLLNGAESVLMTLDSYMHRVRELVLQGANSTNSKQDRIALADEIDKLKDAIVQLGNTTIEDRYIFAGSKINNPAYVQRTPVTGEVRDIERNNIVIDARNNMLKIKLDDQTTKTITLTSKTYDGTSGKTLDDLAADIQEKLRGLGYDIPVYVKVTSDNKLVFYTGPKPPDGKPPHTLVIKDGPAIKEGGFAQKVWGLPANQISLDPTKINTAIPNYYNNWQIKILSGTGAGQVRTVTGTVGPNNILQVNAAWNTGQEPDATSEFQMLPPMEGNGTVVMGNSDFTPNPASIIDGFYENMNITIYDSTGVSETHKITSYVGGTINIGPDTWSHNGAYTYVITPILEGQVDGDVVPPGRGNAVANAWIDLDLATTNDTIPNFYKGASITVTDANGITETHKITGYALLGGPPPTEHRVYVDTPTWKTLTWPCSYKISDTTLSQLGFDNKVTSKELLSTSFEECEPIYVVGDYPDRGTAVTGTPGAIQLGSSALGTDGYYDNWTVTITKGTGVGQKGVINGYIGATHTAPVIGGWEIPPASDSEYTLTPPLQGTVQAALPSPNNRINLAAASSTITDFYKGMTVTIYSGTGEGQTRTITSYEPLTQIATVDQDWAPTPDNNSNYVIDPNPYVEERSKFKITINGNTQEITLDGGMYSVKELAEQIESKIQSRGGHFSNVRVTSTEDKRLRIYYEDPDLDDLDKPLDIKLEKGSKADVLEIIGFTDGSTTGVPIYNYEGDQTQIKFEINVGIQMNINQTGDAVFDPIIDHLSKISIDLRTENTEALSNIDLRNVQKDLDNVLVAQSKMGAKVNQLEKGIERAGIFSENMTKLLSDVEDVDMAKVILDLQMQQTAYQAALQAAGRTMTLLDFLR